MKLWQSAFALEDALQPGVNKLVFPFERRFCFCIKIIAKEVICIFYHNCIPRNSRDCDFSWIIALSAICYSMVIDFYLIPRRKRLDYREIKKRIHWYNSYECILTASLQQVSPCHWDCFSICLQITASTYGILCFCLSLLGLHYFLLSFWRNFNLFFS